MVAIYCRISGKKADGKDVSIEIQEESGIKFAEGLGLPYTLYIDRGISGAKSEIADRPAFAEMFKQIKNKKVTKVYAFDQARIVRKSRIWHLFVYALEKSGCMYYEAGEEVDFNDPQTKLITGIIALVDELYTETTSRKVKVANQKNAEKGKGHGITAYGYKKDEDGYLVIDDEQAKIVREIYNWSLEGIGTYTIANKLNTSGIHPKSFQFKKKNIEKEDKYTKRIMLFPRSKVQWGGNVVYGMIKNPIYKGQRHYGDVVAKIDEIVSEELWDKVNQNLKVNKKNVGPNNKFNYLLNGLIFCADCEAEFRGKYRASGRNKTYSCKGTSQGLKCLMGRGLNIPRFESFIINHLFHSKELYKSLSGLTIKEEKIDRYKSELKQFEKKFKDMVKVEKHLYTLLKDPDLSEDLSIKKDYLKAQKDSETLNDEINVLKNTISLLSTTQRKARLDKIFKEFDYQLNFEQIKQAVHAIIEKITVNHLPGQKVFLVQINYRGFDEQSVFASDHQQMKWTNMSHYQVVPRTLEDKKDDEDLFDFFASTDGYTKEKLIDGLKYINAWDEAYKDWDYPLLLNKVKENSHGEESVINIVTPTIELKKEELYDFNIPS
jgi:DNA invertase Pin-like site-specific DNA recombinase